jgi:hypothetical protein
MCSDAFQFIWTKRQFIAEALRLVDADPAAEAGDAGAVVIAHTHNQLVWSPSHGQPLAPAGYRDLFEGIEPRVFGEARLLDDIVERRLLDLSERHDSEALDKDPALTIVASRHPDVFRPYALPDPGAAPGDLRINPLYDVTREADRLRLRLRFPSADYADEYGACRLYLPDELTVPAFALDALERGSAGPELTDLVRRRVVLRMPARYV